MFAFRLHNTNLLLHSLVVLDRVFVVSTFSRNRFLAYCAKRCALFEAVSGTKPSSETNTGLCHCFLRGEGELMQFWAVELLSINTDSIHNNVSQKGPFLF